MPDVSNPEPLQLRVHASLLKLYAFAHPEACRQGGEALGPDLLLRRGAEQAESDLVDRVAGARERLYLDDRYAVLFVGREGVPPASGRPSAVITVKESSSE